MANPLYAWDSQGRLVWKEGAGWKDGMLIPGGTLVGGPGDPISQPGARYTEYGAIWGDVGDYQNPQAQQQLAPQQAAPAQAPAVPAVGPSATIPQPTAAPRQISQQQPRELAYVPYTGEVPSAQGLQLDFNPNFPAYNVPERVYGGRGGGAGAPGFPGETFLEEDISPFVPFLV